MITENGTIKVNTTMDGKMQKELNGKAEKLALILLIIGAIGVGIFLVLFVISEFINFDESTATTFLICFAVFLGLGIGLKAVLKNSLKNIDALPKINEYEFFKDYFIIDQTLNGENVAHVKVYVNQITKSREGKNYLFFYIGTAAYPVAKGELTEAELNTLRLIFKLPAKGNTITLTAENNVQPAQSAEAVQPQPVIPEPFEDFANKE